ncbi:hypothetical protein J6W34_01070 [bacterium]|nr:hypothetical protein [bacterium]
MKTEDFTFKENDVVSLEYEVHPSNKIIKAKKVKIINIQQTYMRPNNIPYFNFTTQSKLGKIQYWDTLNIISIKKEN